MKSIKSILAAILIAAICLSLAACGLSEEDVVGTWSGSWRFNDNTLQAVFTLNPDGTYSRLTFKNGLFFSSDSGNFTIDGDTVILQATGAAEQTPYTYEDGMLMNSGIHFTKEDRNS